MIGETREGGHWVGLVPFLTFFLVAVSLASVKLYFCCLQSTLLSDYQLILYKKFDASCFTWHLVGCSEFYHHQILHSSHQFVATHLLLPIPELQLLVQQFNSIFGTWNWWQCTGEAVGWFWKEPFEWNCCTVADIPPFLHLPWLLKFIMNVHVKLKFMC